MDVVPPVLWVTPRKQLQVRRLAVAWMAERRAAGSAPRYAEIRFDAVGVVLGREDEVLDLEHLIGAFQVPQSRGCSLRISGCILPQPPWPLLFSFAFGSSP